MLITDPQLFVESLEEQNIYLFASPQSITTEVPHFFICIKRCDGGLLYMTCCTSQFDNKVKFLDTRKLPYETLVFIKPDGNPFHKDTYVNCNDVLPFTIEDLANKVTNQELHFKGKLSDNHFNQILRGIHASPLVEEEIKSLIPTPE